MKKLLVSLLLVLAVTISAEAQPHRKFARRPHRVAPAPRPRYHDRGTSYYYNPIGDFRLHITGDLGINDLEGFFWHEYPCHYSIGGMAELQTGRYLSLGLGAEYYGTLRHYYYGYDEYYNCIPMYGNIRLSTPGYSAKLFVEARAGYAFPLNTVSSHSAQGLFTGAGIGFSIYGNNISVGMNVIDITDGSMATDFYLRYSYAIPLN